MKDKEVSPENESPNNATAAENTDTAVDMVNTDTSDAAADSAADGTAINNVAATTINAAVDTASEGITTDNMTDIANKDTNTDVPSTDNKNNDATDTTNADATADGSDESVRESGGNTGLQDDLVDSDEDFDDKEDEGDQDGEKEESTNSNNKEGDGMEVSQPQSIYMTRKSLFQTDGRAKAVSLAGATEIDMAAHENWMMNALDTSKEHYEYHLGQAGHLFLGKLNPYEQNLREQYARGQLRCPSKSQLRIANYYHTNAYKPYLFSQDKEGSDDEGDDAFVNDGKGNQTLQLQ